MKAKHHFTIIIEKDRNGYYAYCPQLQGCYAQGETYEDALENISDAIKLHIEDRKACEEEWEQPEMVNVTSLELAI